MNRSKLKAGLVIAVMFCLQGIGLAGAAAQGDDAMMSALLCPTGWRAEWQGPGGSGVTELVFQRQGDRLIAKIQLIFPFDMSCEKPVTLGPGTVSFDGCRDPGLTLVFDPADPETPFCGKTPRGYEWRLRAK